MAIRRRPSNELSAYDVACSGLILDDDRLAPALLKLLTDRASQDVGTRACRGRNDDRDCTARRLCHGAACRGSSYGDEKDAPLQQPRFLPEGESAESVHDISPSTAGPDRSEALSGS